MNADTLSKNPEIDVYTENGQEIWEVPPSANTTYLTHGYFRYIGKFPPQIASKLINDFYGGTGKVLDPMVGGGTVLTESVVRNIECVGWDINPVSRLISTSVSRQVDSNQLKQVCESIINALAKLNSDSPLFATSSTFTPYKLRLCKDYFDNDALIELSCALSTLDSLSPHDDIRDLVMMIILSCLRKISFANVKKMNLELDLNKKTKSTLLKEFSSKSKKVCDSNRILPNQFSKDLAKVLCKDAINWDSTEKYNFISIHPPYLTNTAFSEATQLQLAILDICHKQIWQKELKCRGSFLHETNGLKKYIVNWGNIIKNAAESLEKGGHLALVVGDGQIDYIRIPIGAITVELGKDYNLKLAKHAFHVLNNHTGQTQNKKMKGQHVIVFEK
ncbi:hypothetical protein [Geobacter sp. AOG1]|uniref:hypothetical protein n=1 Tax=Geobacter sp. AOG1 TaxID=1566346 RepID=UPI001CC6AD3E|nr:hypothetical protein [Geobacter sp. AOG1]GFE57408.1 hypothetical protein AOG1_12880 [Geobacter sp. AOG1]